MSYVKDFFVLVLCLLVGTFLGVSVVFLGSGLPGTFLDILKSALGVSFFGLIYSWPTLILGTLYTNYLRRN